MLSLIVGFFPVLFICVVLHLFTFGYEPTEVLLQYSAYIIAVAFMFRKVPFRFTSADFTVIGFCVVSMTTALSLLCLINFYAGISYASLFLPNLVAALASFSKRFTVPVQFLLTLQPWWAQQRLPLLLY